MTDATLVLTLPHADGQRLWREAIARGWSIDRLSLTDLAADVTAAPPTAAIAVYCETLLAPAIRKRFGIGLPDIPTDWLPSLPKQFVHRRIELLPAREVAQRPGPLFVKPPNDKSFEAAVLDEPSELPEMVRPDERLLISEPVEFEVEYRTFVLDREVQTLSPYRRFDKLSSQTGFQCPPAERDAARQFAAFVLADTTVAHPSAFVLDLGRLRDGRWAVVEANAAWGSGLYGCDAAAALDVIAAASVAA